jgi:hypothetical protein
MPGMTKKGGTKGGAKGGPQEYGINFNTRF